jgi:hypothetical protein
MLRKLQPKAPGVAAGLAALAAALAAGAVGAMTASATLPELLWCMASASGTYSSAENCEKLVAGGTGFEWEGEPLSGETVTIDTKGLKALLLSVPGNLDIECASSSGSSELTLVEGLDLFTKGVTKFLSCKEVGGFNGACNSTEPAGASGEIITKELTGDLIYLKAGKTTPVGLRLVPKVGSIFTTLSCIGGLLKETVEGAVIGEVNSAVNTPLTAGKVLYSENEVTKKQVWTKVEEGAETFELTAFKEKAIEITEVTTELLASETALTFIMEA